MSPPFSRPTADECSPYYFTYTELVPDGDIVHTLQTQHADIHALSFFADGNTLYVGNDGGVYVTTQITASNPTFTALNNTLGITQFYPGISIHPANASFAIGGTRSCVPGSHRVATVNAFMTVGTYANQRPTVGKLPTVAPSAQCFRPKHCRCAGRFFARAKRCRRWG